MTTADVGVTRFNRPLADWYAVTTRYEGTSAKLASGAMIGIATVASPDDDGMRNDSGRNRKYMIVTKAAPPRFATACSAALSTVSVIRPLFMITVMPRAMPMMSATPSRSRAPSTNVSVNSPSPMRAIRAMMIEKIRNDPVISGNHHHQVGIGTPRSSHGMTP